MDRQLRFSQVDVFSAVATRGNALAVVHDAHDLPDDTMAAFARWTNLSETTFLLPPTDPAADYRVRIFTPGGELPFAGHPTLGSCSAWLAGGGLPRDPERIVQECGVGLVRLRRDGSRLAFAAPPVRMAAVEDDFLNRVLAALGVGHEAVRATQWLSNGPDWLGMLLDSAETVLALEPDHAALRDLAKVGVAGPHPAGAEAAFEVRAFADPVGIREDPVTGSFNASLAQWLIGSGRAPRSYVAAQGARLGRSGRVHVQAEGDPAAGATVWIGGDVTEVVSGSVRL
jgi:PhzF family phenazine biosynthesis protein